MFKSILEWLTGCEPVSRWILIILLLGMAAGLAGFVKRSKPEGEE